MYTNSLTRDQLTIACFVKLLEQVCQYKKRAIKWYNKNLVQSDRSV